MNKKITTLTFTLAEFTLQITYAQLEVQTLSLLWTYWHLFRPRHNNFVTLTYLFLMDTEGHLQKFNTVEPLYNGHFGDRGKWLCSEVAVVGRLQQEWMYGLSAKKVKWPLKRGSHCREVETRVNVWTVHQKSGLCREVETRVNVWTVPHKSGCSREVETRVNVWTVRRKKWPS